MFCNPRLRGAAAPAGTGAGASLRHCESTAARRQATMSLLADDAQANKKANQYSSRMARARAANTTKFSGSASLSSAKTISDDADGVGTNMSREIQMSVPAAPSTPKRPVAPVVEGQASALYAPEEEGTSVSQWDWNSDQKLLALVRRRCTQPSGPAHTLLARTARIRQTAATPAARRCPTHAPLACALTIVRARPCAG